MKNTIEILIGIAVNLYLVLGTIHWAFWTFFLADTCVILEIKYRQESIKFLGLFLFINKMCCLTIQVGHVVYKDDFNFRARFILALGILANQEVAMPSHTYYSSFLL